MKKSVKVVVNDKSYLVEIEDLSTSPLKVFVNGKEYSVCLDTAEESTPAASAETPAAVIPVGKPAAGTNSANILVAPMPGVILDIVIKPGDKVTYGTNLCALEAMKMKNAIRSPRDGVIASVEVTEGQRVAYGDVMFKFA